MPAIEHRDGQQIDEAQVGRKRRSQGQQAHNAFLRLAVDELRDEDGAADGFSRDHPLDHLHQGHDHVHDGPPRFLGRKDKALPGGKLHGHDFFCGHDAEHGHGDGFAEDVLALAQLRGDLQADVLAVAFDGKGDGPVFGILDLVGKIVPEGDGAAVDGQHAVPILEPGAGGRAVGQHLADGRGQAHLPLGGEKRPVDAPGPQEVERRPGRHHAHALPHRPQAEKQVLGDGGSSSCSGDSPASMT
jgi:hypothetical protein